MLSQLELLTCKLEDKCGKDIVVLLACADGGCNITTDMTEGHWNLWHVDNKVYLMI